MSGDLFCEPIKGYQPSPNISELPDIRWRSSIRDLVELLMVLNELGVFSDRENNPINFTRLVGIASNTLGVEIKQPFKIRNDILARTGDKDFFTERMEEVEFPWDELMRMWLEYKKARNEAYTSEIGTKACLTKLKKLSGNFPQSAQAIIEQSMANNWAGLFPLSAQTSRGRPPGSGSLVPATGQRIGQILQPETEEHRNAILDKFKRKAAADMSHRPSEQKDNTND